MVRFPGSAHFFPANVRSLIVTLLAIASIAGSNSATAGADFRAAARKLIPATVGITRVEAAAKGIGLITGVEASTKSGIFLPNEVSYFLRDGRLVQQTPAQDAQPKNVNAVSVWCGVLVSADGWIATVSDGRVPGDLEVQLSDGRVLPARIRVDDRRTGLWLLKVELAGAPFVQLAAGDVEVGQDILECLPDGQKSRQIAPGIVAAMGRRLIDVGPAVIPTSLYVHDGAAGAPVSNATGELVGLVSAGHGGSSPGVTFVVPASHVKSLLESRFANGVVTVDAGLLGITPVPGKLVLQDVHAGGPAAKVGLRPGDVIVAIDGHVFLLSDDLIEFVRMREPGTKVVIKYRRAGKESSVQAVLGRLPHSDRQQQVKWDVLMDDVVQFDVKLWDPAKTPAVQWKSATLANVGPSTFTPAPVVVAEKTDAEKRIEQLQEEVKLLRTGIATLRSQLDGLQKELNGLTEIRKKK